MFSHQPYSRENTKNTHLNSIEVNVKNLELDTITLLQNDAVQDFSNTQYFQQAMENIRILCDCEFICFASSFYDNANEEYLISIFSFYEGVLQKFHFTIDSTKREQNKILNSKTINEKKFTFEFISELSGLITLSKEHHHTSELDLLSLTLEKTATKSECHYNFFKDKGHVSGWLIHDSEEQDFLVERFPTLHSTLEFLLSNEMNKVKAKNEINTYQQVLDLMPQRVFWKNRNSVYTGSNLAFATDASKNKASDLIGLTDFDLFPGQAQLYRSDDANTMKSNVHLINSEEPQTHENGNTIWLRTSKRPIIGSDNKVIGIVGTYDEITELKNVQAQLLEAKEELELRVEKRTQELSNTVNELQKAQTQLIESEKMAALGGLVAGIAHEINTPVGISVTAVSHLNELTQNLQSDYENQALKKSSLANYCEKLLDSSSIIMTNLNKAANQIENFKLIAVDQSMDIERQFDISLYLKSIINTLSPKLRNKNIKIITNVPDQCLATTYPGALSQVITNLVDNSIIHGFAERDSGEINIDIISDDNDVIIKYQDNGQGMSQDKVDKVYDPFYTTKRGQGGSGLGMHIVYNLISQQLKGNITCSSNVGHGTQFDIIIAQLD